MKKFFAIMAAALVAFSFASCKGGNEPENEAYKIEISNITAKGATIAVTPADSTVTYYWDIIEASEAAKMDDDAVAAYYKEYFDYVIDYYAGYYDLTYEDLVLKGYDEYEYTSLDANTEYTVVAIALDANIGAAGKSVRKNFKTLELKEDPVPADMTFEIAASDITFSGATISVTPSNNEATYYWNVFEAAEIAQMSDADLCTNIKDNIEYTIEYYAYFGYDVTFEDFLSKGPDAYEYDDLNPNTEYTVVAVAMGTLGTTNGAVAKYNFSTPEVEVLAQETVEFTGVYDDEVAEEGWYQIMAYNADSTLYISLSPDPVESLTQAITFEDLDADWSYIYVGENKLALADAAYTAELNGDTLTATGKFLAMNGTEYTFTAVCEPYVAAEYDYAPAKLAKKAQAKKELKEFKKGNMKKSVKRSEKLFNL